MEFKKENKKKHNSFLGNSSSLMLEAILEAMKFNQGPQRADWKSGCGDVTWGWQTARVTVLVLTLKCLLQLSSVTALAFSQLCGELICLTTPCLDPLFKAFFEHFMESRSLRSTYYTKNSVLFSHELMPLSCFGCSEII